MEESIYSLFIKEMTDSDSEKWVSKYWIAKQCHVHWNTVNAWENGLFQPVGANKDRFDAMYRKWSLRTNRGYKNKE